DRLVLDEVAVEDPHLATPQEFVGSAMSSLTTPCLISWNTFAVHRHDRDLPGEPALLEDARGAGRHEGHGRGRHDRRAGGGRQRGRSGAAGDRGAGHGDAALAVGALAPAGGVVTRAIRTLSLTAPIALAGCGDASGYELGRYSAVGHW